MEVDVDDVEPHVAGPRVAHDRVQVGAVVVQGAARVADHPGDLGDVLVEQAERVRVGEHQAGDLARRPWSAGRRGPPRRARRSPP